MNELKVAKAELQDTLLDLLRKFEGKWGVSISQITLYHKQVVGEGIARTHSVEMRVEV